MEKFRETDIKPFQFSDLKSATTAKGEDFKPFSFGEIKGTSVSREKVTEDNIRNERNFAKKNNFKIDEIVRDYRGLSRQEQNDLEKKIQDEVNRRLEAAYKEAFEQGLTEGREAGKTEAFASTEEAFQQKINEFSNTVVDIQAQSTTYMQSHKKEIIEFVKRFTKWVCLKEINEQVYLENLLEKLILEMNTKQNLIVKVGRDNFKQMPEVVKAVEAKVGSLTNVRLEIVPELNYPGIILESANGLIDGSMEGVFANIDKIFEQVLKHE